MTKPLTTQQAKALYQVLVDGAQAPATPHDFNSFVFEFTGAAPTNEWRFIGCLGFGGKLRYPRLTVDCYPEDETPERLAAIEATNIKLAALAASWATQG